MQPTSSNDTAKSFCEFMVPLACDVGGFDRIIRHHNKRDGTNVDRLAGSRIYLATAAANACGEITLFIGSSARCQQPLAGLSVCKLGICRHDFRDQPRQIKRVIRHQSSPMALA